MSRAAAARSKGPAARRSTLPVPLASPRSSSNSPSFSSPASRMAASSAASKGKRPKPADTLPPAGQSKRVPDVSMSDAKRLTMLAARLWRPPPRCRTHSSSKTCRSATLNCASDWTSAASSAATAASASPRRRCARITSRTDAMDSATGATDDELGGTDTTPSDNRCIMRARTRGVARPRSESALAPDGARAPRSKRRKATASWPDSSAQSRGVRP
mmetsp:Transcript_53361/g.148401  ORF Transcript_53361/g.148401 Transcript_53361/m.148401 type:complete len:216 (+) Transcript_53361:125-772(+)